MADDVLIGVAAHISRLDMAHQLAERMGADAINVDWTDAGSEPEAVTACAANHFTVLSELAEKIEGHRWILMFEDDALPIEDFETHLTDALRWAPQPIVGFYLGMIAHTQQNYKARDLALEQGIPWVLADHLVSAVSYAVHTRYLPSILRRWPGFHADASVEYRLTQWALELRGGMDTPRFCYPIPSMVDHAECESLVWENTNAAVRRAWTLGVPEWGSDAIEYNL